MNRQPETRTQGAFIVLDRNGNKAAGPFTELKRARRAVDRIDNRYGAYGARVVTLDGRGF